MTCYQHIKLTQHLKNYKEYDDAVVQFQNALRVDGKDGLCWQGLAETYRRQGKYMAALKAFSRAVEIDPSLSYSLYEMANIERMLGETDKAVVHFRSTLQSNPEYLPALKGLAETYLSEFKQHLKYFCYFADFRFNSLFLSCKFFNSCN